MVGKKDNRSAKSAKPSPRRVVILAFDGAEPVDIAGPSSVFARAARMAPGAYDLVHASAGRLSVRTTAGIELSGLRPLSLIRGDIDTLIVAGGSEDALWSLAQDRAFVAMLKRRAARARRTASVCTGAFLLAGAGLLDGRRAVTHWNACALLQRLSPTTTVVADAIFVVDGPVWTSAGVTAGIDLALALVEADLGPALAARIAKDMVVYLRRPGGQAQFSDQVHAAASAGDAFAELIAWMTERPSRDLSVAALARRAGMTERTFMRRFRAETGATPAAFVRQVRLDWARREIEQGVRPIKTIVSLAGFGSEDSLERAFRLAFGATPGELRRRFGASAP